MRLGRWENGLQKKWEVFADVLRHFCRNDSVKIGQPDLYIVYSYILIDKNDFVDFRDFSRFAIADSEKHQKEGIKSIDLTEWIMKEAGE